jgi:hypothetical protein
MKTLGGPAAEERAAAGSRFSSPISPGVQDSLAFCVHERLATERVLFVLVNWVMKNATLASPSFG